MFFLFKFARRIISAVLSVVILLLVALAGYLYLNAREANLTPTDAIVVLGAAQYDGTPTEVFQNRLDHAIDLYKLKLAPRIITVGGKQKGDRFTEAQSGADYLIAMGIPPQDILAVPTGSNTIQSLVAIDALMKKHKWTSITVSTDPLHAARVIVISNKLGLKAFPNPTLTGPGTDLGGSRAITEMAGILWFFGWEQWSI
ncbi:MAG: hypothetical protein RIS43_722 [Actinomycetota bacterium]|jgi:vancomycin permeability regulator SanA